jgi:hypothetical protein
VSAMSSDVPTCLADNGSNNMKSAEIKRITIAILMVKAFSITVWI